MKLVDIDDDKTQALQKEINSVLAKIRTTTEQIQKTTRENHLLRQEIARMRQLLTQQIVPEPL